MTIKDWKDQNTARSQMDLTGCTILADECDVYDKARASALNDKVQNPLSKSGTGLPQSMSTGGGKRGESKPKSDGSLAQFAQNLMV